MSRDIKTIPQPFPIKSIFQINIIRVLVSSTSYLRQKTSINLKSACYQKKEMLEQENIKDISHNSESNNWRKQWKEGKESQTVTLKKDAQVSDSQGLLMLSVFKISVKKT